MTDITLEAQLRKRAEDSFTYADSMLFLVAADALAELTTENQRLQAQCDKHWADGQTIADESADFERERDEARAENERLTLALDDLHNDLNRYEAGDGWIGRATRAEAALVEANRRIDAALATKPGGFNDTPRLGAILRILTTDPNPEQENT